MRDGPVKKNIDSITNLQSLLLRVCASPLIFLGNVELVTALNSQHSLAKYSNLEEGITASSLNTHKRLSKEIIKDGYSGLDALRCRALEALEALKVAALVSEATDKSKRSVAGLKEKIVDLKGKLSTARQDCWHLTTAFVGAIRTGENMALNSTDPALKALWVKSRSELLAMVNFANCKIDTSKPLGDHDISDK